MNKLYSHGDRNKRKKKMELALYRHDGGHEFARVNKRLKDKYGRPIVIAEDNPILYIRMYRV